MEVFKTILVVLGTTLVIGLLMALPTMWLWNWLMPKIFDLTTLTFIEALGVSVLSSILFKSTGSSSK